MNNEYIYYLVTIDFCYESKPESETSHYIMTGSCYTDVVERIFKEIADNDEVLSFNIEEIGEYPTLEEINDLINRRK